MEKKREVILNSSKLRAVLTIEDELPSHNGIILNSNEYAAVGCDLRNLRRLDRLVKKVASLKDCLVLCVAEVSLAYMSVKDSDAVLSWATTLSPGT